MRIKYYKLLAFFVLACGLGLKAQTPVAAGGPKKVETNRNESVFLPAGSVARDGRNVEGVAELPKKVGSLPFEAQETWVMSSVALLDNSGDKSFSSSEENAVKADFVSGKTLLIYDGKGGFKLESLKGVFYQGLEQRHGSNITWTMGDEECATCGKKLYLILLEQNSDHMTIKMASEDKGEALSYVFNFVKSNP